MKYTNNETMIITSNSGIYKTWVKVVLEYTDSHLLLFGNRQRLSQKSMLSDESCWFSQIFNPFITNGPFLYS